MPDAVFRDTRDIVWRDSRDARWIKIIVRGGKTQIDYGSGGGMGMRRRKPFPDRDDEDIMTIMVILSESGVFD